MNFIDQTYFTKHPILLPQSEGVSNGVASQIAGSDLAIILDNITVYEKKFLYELLGRDVANEFIVGIAETTPEQKWVDLKNVLVDETNKTSPIANYCYTKILPQIQQTSTRVGVVGSKINEGMAIDITPKQVLAWNLMVDDLYHVITYLCNNKDLYEHDEVYLYTNDALLTKTNVYGI